MPDPVVPSVAGVIRARYWSRAILRAAALTLAAVSLLRALDWAVYCLFSSAPLQLFSLVEFWQAMIPAAAGALLLFASDPLTRWMFPMPRPLCPECGYQIRAQTARCPECGLTLAGASSAGS